MYLVFVKSIIWKYVDLKHFSKEYKWCKYDDCDDDDYNVQSPPAVASRTTVQCGGGSWAGFVIWVTSSQFLSETIFQFCESEMFIV